MLRKEKSAKLLIAMVVLSFIVIGGNSGQASATEIPASPVIVLPEEPLWNDYNGTITTNAELQNAINEATTATKIVLTCDIDTASIVIPDGKVIFITSEAGKNYKLDNGGGNGDFGIPIAIEEGGTLYIEDITITNGKRTANGGGGGVLVGWNKPGSQEGAVFVMKSGVISGNVALFGGGVYVSSLSRFYMLGGCITDNEVSNGGSGGGVYTYNGGSFFMTGDSEISYNKSKTKGSGVCVDGNGTQVSTFTMTGGKIIHNSGGTRGGVSVHAGSTFNLSGPSEISQNSSSGAGGVYIDSAFFNMYDGAKICKNSGFYGGGVNVSKIKGQETDESVFNMYGGVIGGDSPEDANKGKYPGLMAGTQNWGNKGGTLNLYGGKISYNGSRNANEGYGAGLALTSKGIANIQGNVEISDNFAKNLGGGIYVQESEMYISGNAKIINNISSIGGGAGIYIYYKSSTNISGNTIISGNTAQGNGGGIFIDTSSTLSLDSGVISNNTAQGNGGAIYLTDQNKNSRIYLNGGIISNNTAQENGGGIFVNNKAYEQLFLPEDQTVIFSDNKSVQMNMALELPNLGEWSGTIGETSVDDIDFSGEIGAAIDRFVEAGNDAKNLTVFNNYDINMEPVAGKKFFSVTYKPGIVMDTDYALYGIQEGEEYTILDVTDENIDFSELGYRFMGWEYSDDLSNTLPDLLTEGDTFQMPEANVVLTAQWEENDAFQVTYRTASRSDADYIVSDLYEGDEHTVLDIADSNIGFTKPGYMFTGWKYSDGLGNTFADLLTEGDTFQMPGANVVLTAQWKKEGTTPSIPEDTFKVTYKMASSSDADYVVPDLHENDVHTVLGVTDRNIGFVKPGYRFTGWKYSDDLGNTLAGLLTKGDTFQMPEANVVLTAQWKKVGSGSGNGGGSGQPKPTVPETTAPATPETTAPTNPELPILPEIPPGITIDISDFPPGVHEIIIYDNDGVPLGRYFITIDANGVPLGVPKAGDQSVSNIVILMILLISVLGAGTMFIRRKKEF